MRIITVRQPWAHAIVHGGKDVENRARNIAGNYRGPVAIHAALQRDDRGWVEFGAYALTNTMHHGQPEALGAIIGVVDLVDVHRPLWDDSCGEPGEGVCSPWAETTGWPYHLVLANPRPLAEPLPFKGALGLRTLDAETTARVLAAVAA
ncbi:ASCH domain-containing protein [Microbacterium gilvum]|uniref:ASCH domain-containing protein n=1 Tax=Microbacterium gilvum TaxID=1336204 RepID=A0ABP8ZQI3_9MICO